MKPNEIFIKSARVMDGKELKQRIKINKLIKKSDKKKELKELKDKYPGQSVYLFTIEK